SMAEFVDAFNALEPQVRNPVPSVAALEVAVDGGCLATSNGDGSRRSRLVAVGGTPGAGATELAIGLTAALRVRREHAVLVDAAEVVPSIAQALGLPIEPSLRSAIESVEYGMGDVDVSTVRAAREIEPLPCLPTAPPSSHPR